MYAHGVVRRLLEGTRAYTEFFVARPPYNLGARSGPGPGQLSPVVLEAATDSSDLT
jgi:hypothetical protein